MSPMRAPLLALALLAVGCAGGNRAIRASTLPPPATESRTGPPSAGAGPAPGLASRLPREVAVRRAIDVASSQVGQRQIVVEGVRYGDGCSALVRAAFALAGFPLPPDADATALLALARARAGTRRTAPVPGDLVFLADRPGGAADHVGIVSSVSADGTALVLHHTERGVARIRVNGAHSWKVRSETGRALNDILVVGAGKITAGRLLVGYATLL